MRNVKKIIVVLPKKSELHDSSTTFIKRLSQSFPDSRISTFEVKMLRKSDINWLGVPNKNFLSHIRDEKYDLLIDINTVQDRLCCYLDALSNAAVRIHLVPGKFDYIYNIQIRSDAEIPLTTRYDTLLNYLEILHKN